jgi:hypothetical protein
LSNLNNFKNLSLNNFSIWTFFGFEQKNCSKIQNLLKIQICFILKICSNSKFVHNSKFVQNSNFVQTQNLLKIQILFNSNFFQILKKFNIWNFVQKSNYVQNSKLFRFQKRETLKKKNLGGIYYWAGPCMELHGRVLLMRATARCIGAPAPRLPGQRQFCEPHDTLADPPSTPKAKLSSHRRMCLLEM